MADNLEFSLRLKAAVEGIKKISGLIEEIEALGGEVGDAGAQSRELSAALSKLQSNSDLIDQFRRLKTQVASTSNELAEAQADTQALGKELAATTKPSRRLQQRFAKARRTVRDLKEAQIAHTRALQESRQALGRAGIASDHLAKAQSRIQRELKETAARSGKLTSELKQLRAATKRDLKDPTSKLRKGLRQTEDAADDTRGGLRRVAAGVVAFLAAYSGFNLLKQGIASILKTGSSFESLAIQLENLTGSAAAGQEALAWIRQFAKKTPLQLEEVTKAFVRLKAFGMDPMNGTLQALVDQNAELGGGQERLLGIVNAVGQAFAKQRLQGEEILQLIERGVPVYELLSRALGKNVAELRAMQEAGEIGRREIKLLVAEIAKSTEGAAARNMSAFRGLVSNTQDVFTRFLNRIADAGVLEYAKQQLKELLEAAKRLAENGTLQRWAQKISNALVATGEAIKSFVGFLYEMRGALALMAKALAVVALAKFAGGILSLASRFRNFLLPALAAGRKGALGFGAALRRIPTSIKVAIAVIGFDLLVKAGKAIGELAARASLALSDYDENLARIRKHHRDFAVEQIKQGQKIAAQYAKYKDTLVLTAEQVARLSDAERAAYKERLEGLQNYLGGRAAVAIRLKDYGDQEAATFERIKNKLAAVRTGLADFTAGTKLAASAVASDISPAAQKLIDIFNGLLKSGKSVDAAMDSLFAGFDAGNVNKVRALAEAMGQLSGQSSQLALTLQTRLRTELQKLSGAALIKFQITARAAFASVGADATALAGVLDATLDAALVKLGLDLEKFRSGMSSAGKEAIDTFNAILETGIATQEQVTAALEAASKLVTTDAGVKNLQAAAERAVRANVLSARAAEKIITSIVTETEAAAKQMAAQFKAAIAAASDQRQVTQVINEINAAYKAGNLTLKQRIALLEQASAAAKKQQAASVAATSASKASAEASKEAGKAGKKVGTDIKEGADQASDAIRQVSSDTKEAGESAKSFASDVGAAITGYFSLLGKLSGKAVAQFKNKMTFGPQIEQTDKLRAKIDSIGKSLAYSQRLAGRATNSFGKYFSKLAIAYKETKLQFYQQQLRAREFTEQLTSGAIPAARLLGYTAEQLKGRFDLLGEQQLSGLINALQQAQAETKRLRDAAEDTLSNLREELLGIQGNYEELARLRQQQRQAELKAKIATAEARGDKQAVADLREALRLLQQIGRARLAEAKERTRRERAERDSEKKSAQTAQRHEVTIRTEDGEAVTLEGGQADAENFISLLQRAGMRAQ